MASKQTLLFDSVRTHAFSQLSYSRRQKTNLYLDQRVYKSGETIGPERQKIKARRPSILVFADDDPRANFAHACRYLLYDADSGEFDGAVPAEFPPFVKAQPKTLQAFHEPVRFVETPNIFRIKPALRCVSFPKGRRFAILYSGMSNKRHLNDMEFLYRTLLDRYSFDPKDISVLHYDGTLNTQDGVQVNWPGDGTKYRIKINGKGTRAAFESAVDSLKGKLKGDDLLLVHTNNHGGWDGVAGTANLCTFPNWDGYYATDFANKVGELPKYRKLIVMMEQCHAGGFNAKILAKSTADATSVASAAIEALNSYVSADGNWDPFARDWIAAQTGNDAFGAGLASNPDLDHDGNISAFEAYSYADSIALPNDSPNFNQSSAAGGAITLGQEYTGVPWWCHIVLETLKSKYLKLPPEEFYRMVREILPELAALTVSIDERSSALQREFAPKIEAIVNGKFGKDKAR